MEKLLLSIAETAKMLGVGTSIVYELTAQEDFPVITIGKTKKVPVKALQSWVEEHTQRKRDNT